MAKIIVENFKLENHVNLPEADARAAFARIRHNVIRKQLQTLEKAGQQSTQAYKTAMKAGVIKYTVFWKKSDLLPLNSKP